MSRSDSSAARETGVVRDAAAFALDDHAREPRWQRKREHATTDVGQPRALVDGPEPTEQRLRGGQGRLGRRIEPREFTQVGDAGPVQAERRFGEIFAQDFRLVVLRSRGEITRRVEPEHASLVGYGRLAPRAASPRRG